MLVGETCYEHEVMVVPAASIVDSCFVQLVEIHIELAVCPVARFSFVGVGNVVVVGVGAVVALLDSSKRIHLQARNGFDIHRSLDRAAEVVTILITLVCVEPLYGVVLSRVAGDIVRAVFVVDRHGRVQLRSDGEVGCGVVVAVVHVREVVLQFQPAVQALLVSRQFGYNLFAAVVLGDTLRIFVVERSAVAEVTVCAGDSHVMVMGNCCLACESRCPVGGSPMVKSRQLAAGGFAEGAELLCICHTHARVDPCHVHIARVFQLRLYFVAECLAALGGDKDNAVRSARTIYSRCRTVFEHVHRCNLVGSDIVDIAGRHTVHNIQRRRARTLTEGGETTNLYVIAC